MVVAAGTDWAGTWTAAGTVALAVVTLAAVVTTIVITIQDRRRAEVRLREELARSRAEMEEERRIAREREQFAAAYAVQVVFVRGASEGEGEDEAQRLMAVIVNHAVQAITRIEALFSLDELTTISASRQVRLPVRLNMPPQVRVIPEFVEPAEAAYRADVLTRWDTGLLIETTLTGVRHLADPGVVVRWTDWQGARWEHRRGWCGWWMRARSGCRSGYDGELSPVPVPWAGGSAGGWRWSRTLSMTTLAPYPPAAWRVPSITLWAASSRSCCQFRCASCGSWAGAGWFSISSMWRVFRRGLGCVMVPLPPCAWVRLVAPACASR